MRSLSLLILVAGLVLAGSLGCNPTLVEVKRVRVTGKVTFDNKPLPTGKITFDPSDGSVPAVCDILDGRYEGLAPVGKQKVMITSFKKVSMKEKMKMDGPGYDEPVDENILPDRYSLKSEITREVTEEGPNEFNFELQSK